MNGMSVMLFFTPTPKLKTIYSICLISKYHNYWRNLLH